MLLSFVMLPVTIVLCWLFLRFKYEYCVRTKAFYLCCLAASAVAILVGIVLFAAIAAFILETKEDDYGIGVLILASIFNGLVGAFCTLILWFSTAQLPAASRIAD